MMREFKSIYIVFKRRKIRKKEEGTWSVRLWLYIIIIRLWLYIIIIIIIIIICVWCIITSDQLPKATHIFLNVKKKKTCTTIN